MLFSIVAVTVDGADEDDIRRWLAEIVQAVPSELGVADEIEAKTADEISLTFLETSFSADASQLTWREFTPSGATGRYSHPVGSTDSPPIQSIPLENEGLIQWAMSLANRILRAWRKSR